jgi:hypothetical protein
MAVATSGHGLELMHAKLVPRLGYVGTFAAVAACLYCNFFIGVEEVGRTPGVKIPVAPLHPSEAGLRWDGSAAAGVRDASHVRGRLSVVFSDFHPQLAGCIALRMGCNRKCSPILVMGAD